MERQYSFLRVSKEQHSRLMNLAAASNISIRQFTDYLIDKAFEQQVRLQKSESVSEVESATDTAQKV